MMEIQSNQPPAIPSWVLLDQEFLYKDAGGETTAEACDTTGEPVRVSFDLHAPPGSSRLCLHYCPEEREPSGWDTVVAAHGDALLFRVEVDFEGLPFRRPRATDYFIYRAAGSSSGPALSLLPRCYSTEAEIMAAAEDDAASSWRSEWRMVDTNSIGLLLAGDHQDFVVAELQINWLEDTAAPLEAELFRLRSSSSASPHAANGGQWELARVTSRGGKVSFQDVLWWRTHRVVPFASYLCWVDYYRGLLLCDVYHKNPELQYLPLPVDVPRGVPDVCYTGCPQVSRTVCVTKGETMKFVDVVRASNGVLSCPACKYGFGFTIVVWTLSVINYDDMEWVEDFMIKADELWSMEGYDQLPRFVPEFPLVSMDEPHILYFVLSNRPAFRDEQSWIVALDMESKKILRYEDMIKAFPSDNIFCRFGFFPTNFSNYLKKLDSRENTVSEEKKKRTKPKKKRTARKNQ